MDDNYYPMFKLKEVIFNNFETTSPNFPAPFAPIQLELININIQYDIRFF